MGKYVLTAILLTIKTAATVGSLTILMTLLEYLSMNIFPKVCKNHVKEEY
jgi:hypothetical protein